MPVLAKCISFNTRFGWECLPAWRSCSSNSQEPYGMATGAFSLAIPGGSNSKNSKTLLFLVFSRQGQNQALTWSAGRGCGLTVEEEAEEGERRCHTKVSWHSEREGSEKASGSSLPASDGLPARLPPRETQTSILLDLILCCNICNILNTSLKK